MKRASTNARGPGWNRYLILAGMVLAAFLGWYFGVGNLAALVRGAEKLPLAAMALLIVAGFWIRAVKWGHALGPGQSGVFLFFLAKTAGHWTPGRAGELAPLLLRDHRNVRIAAWIGLDRAVEVAWTLGLGVLGVAAIGVLSPAAAAGLLVAGAALAAALWWWCATVSLADADEKTASNWSRRLLRLLQRLRREVALFKRKLPGIMALTATAKLTDIIAVILLCDAFSYDVSFLLVCAARCAHGLVSAIPVTPDATGAPFVAAAWLLHKHAGVPFDVLTAALALEVAVITAILWGSFCLISWRHWNTRE